MAKTSKKQKKTTVKNTVLTVVRRPVNKPKKTSTKSRPSGGGGDVEYVCALTDAFCPARNTKVMSMSNAKTLAYRQVYGLSITTDVNGNASVWFPSPYPGLKMVCPTSVDNATLVATTAAGSYASLATISGIQQYRVVNAGIRLTRVIDDFHNGGYHRILIPTTAEVTTLAAYDIGAYTYDKISQSAVSGPNVIEIPFQRYAGVRPETFFNYASPTTAIGSSNNYYMFPTIISVVGAAASSTIYRVEIITNYELTFADDQGMAMLATNPPIYRSVIEDASYAVRSTLKEAAYYGANAFSRIVKGLAVQALQARFPATRAIMNVD